MTGTDAQSPGGAEAEPDASDDAQWDASLDASLDASSGAPVAASDGGALDATSAPDSAPVIHEAGCLHHCQDGDLTIDAAVDAASTEPDASPSQCAVNNGGCGDPLRTRCVDRISAPPECVPVDPCRRDQGRCDAPCTLRADRLDWALAIEGGFDSVTSGRGIAMLADGSVVITGAFADRVTFAAGEANETTLTRAQPRPDMYSVNRDGYLARYRADGGFVWAQQIKAPSIAEGRALAVTPEGAIALTGYFTPSATFGSGAGNPTTVMPVAEGASAFVALYDIAGALLWVRHPAGGLSLGSAIAAWSDGSLLWGGELRRKVTFGMGEPRQTQLSGADFDPGGFTALLDPAGQLRWAVNNGGAEVLGVALTPDGLPLAAASNGDAVLLQYDRADGTLQATTREGGSGGAAAYAVAVAKDGARLLAGIFQAQLTLGAGQAHETTLTGAANSNGFLARYTANGALAWAKRLAGSAGAGTSSSAAKAVAVRDDGAVVVTGYFHDRMTLGAGEPNETTLVATGSGWHDMFIAEFSRDGTLRWARRAGGQFPTEGWALALAPSGAVYVTGIFESIYGNTRINFDKGDGREWSLTAKSASAAYLARYGVCEP